MRSLSRTPAWLWLVAAMTAVGPVSIDMYLPGFPEIERDFGQSGVEGTMAAYLFGVAAGQLFYGPLSDRFGRKRPLYAGFLLYSLGALGCALATNMLMLTVARVVQALGGCAGMVIGRAIVRDRSDLNEAARAFSTLAMIVSLGPVLAPAGGGMVVVAFGWRATFIFQAALGVVLMIAMHLALDDSREGAPPARMSVLAVFGLYVRLLKDRALVGYTLVGGFGMASMFAYVTGAPIVLTSRYHLSTQQFGWLIALNGLAFLTASRLNIRSLHTMSPQQVLARYIWAPAALAGTLLVATLLWTTPLWVIVVLQLSFFVSVGRINPNVFALALDPHAANAGAASALMGALQSVAAVAAGVAVAIFNNGEPSTLAAIMAAGGLLAAATYLWVSRRR